MDILTLELFDLTVSQAVLEVRRALDAYPGVAIRIVLDDETHKYNVTKLLDKRGRVYNITVKGLIETIDVNAAKKPSFSPPTVIISSDQQRPETRQKPAETNPILVLSGSIGTGDPITGRRLLLEILKRADKQIPWIGLAYEGALLLSDPAGRKVLHDLLGSGVSIRVSRECMMFHPEETSGFEVMQDSEWQSLLLKGNVTKF